MKKTHKEPGIVTAVLLAVFLLITSTSGCVSQTPSPSPTPHDTLLEGLVATQYNQTAGKATITTWNVTWSNSTTVNIQFAVQNQTQNATASGNRTFMRFSSIDTATSFVNGSDLTGYALNANVPASAFGLLNFSLGRLYESVTGHPPAQYLMYVKALEGPNSLTILSIAQADDVVSLANVTAVRTNVSPIVSPLPSVSTIPAPTPSPSVSPVPTQITTAPVTTTPTVTAAPSSSVVYTTTAAAR